MRSKQPWQRLFALYGTEIIAGLMNIIAVMLYWDGRIIEPWMISPIRWQDELEGAIMFTLWTKRPIFYT